MLKRTFAIALVAALIAAAGWVSCSKKKPTASTTTGTGAGTISGIVTKSADSTLIFGAAISTTPATSSVTTNIDGRYTIYSVAVGNYAVNVSIKGYISKTISVTVTPDNTTTANISLADNATIIEWITITAGNFTMGSLPGDPYARTDEQPQHTVYLNTYQISKYEVTNAQYKAFMDAGGYTNPAYWTTDGWAWRTTNSITEPYWWTSGSYNSGPGFPNHPVVGISWYEADAFSHWVGGSLPTEAQWEKAARWTDTRYYPWGNTWDASKCNSWFNTAPDTFAYSSPVGFFSSGVSYYGVYDMAGNVWEWVNDWYQSDYYSVTPSSNPTGPTTDTYRVLRGGSFNGAADGCRVVSRNFNAPDLRLSYYGYRVSQ
ncbi:MAG: SUMF1/EgtB/PvdO family nonheme iron enzyme [Candidatus Edwardsbacteria bacterium]|nr:SUMF1/EgtB/PvdO family nonheme iron enzyme [Candidatus Edwardsbacteria bacterium]